MFATHAMQRLTTVKTHAVRSQDGKISPEWYADYDRSRQEYLATMERERREMKSFQNCFPEKARVLLTLKSSDMDIGDRPEETQGRQLATTIGDPVQLLVMSCKALAPRRIGRSELPGKRSFLKP